MNYLQRILGILFSVDDFRFVVCMDTILSFSYNKHCKNYLALWLPSPGQFFLREQTVNKKCLRLIAEDTSKKHKICKSMLWGGGRGDAQSESNHFVA